MITAEQKPMQEIIASVAPYDRILLIGCNECVTVCSAGGRKEVGLLASALARPRNAFAYGGDDVDLAALAAAYAYGIASNHPFVDGNERVAYVVCRTFLRLNGVDFEATAEEKFGAFMRLAAGQTSEEELAAWIRERRVDLA